MPLWTITFGVDYIDEINILKKFLYSSPEWHLPKLRLEIHRFIYSIFFLPSSFLSLSFPLFITSQHQGICRFLFIFCQKIDSKAISWLYKGKSCFLKLREKQDFLVPLGFGYNVQQLAYETHGWRIFMALKRKCWTISTTFGL